MLSSTKPMLALLLVSADCFGFVCAAGSTIRAPPPVKRIPLGVCFAGRDCDPDKSASVKVTGDPQATDEPIYSNVPFCKSFFAIPDPPVKLQACRSENCVAACDAAYTWGSCVSVPADAAPDARYDCIRRVTWNASVVVENE